MVVKSINRAVFTVLYTIVLLLDLFAIKSYVYGYNGNYGVLLQLKWIGIAVPREDIGSVLSVYSIRIDNISLGVVSNYTVISINVLSGSGSVEYTSSPGEPVLPYLVYITTVEGYVHGVRLWVEPESFRVFSLPRKIKPVPKPLMFTPSLSQRFEYVEDAEIYSSDRYFPGVLAEAEVFHGLLGRSIISVKVYPVHYNPVKGRLVLVDKLRVAVGYDAVERTVFKSNSVVVITTPWLVDIVNKTLASVYRARGYSVDIVDTAYIYSHYQEVRNITEYPGFYYSEFHKLSGLYNKDYVYRELVRYYNFSLALRIMSFLNATYGNYSHVVIVGDAFDIPPSFYFFSTTAYLKTSLYNAWIPTDIFYADLDRDLVPDLYVGRIPFSDPEAVSFIAKKIERWYSSEAAKSDKLVMAGGYPFLHPLMFGETALSTMVMSGDTSTFYTILLTRTSGNYTKESILSVLQGNTSAIWLFIISHGSGDAFIDYVVKLNQIDIEHIWSYEIESLKENPGPPIVSSVACMNGAWDTELISPDIDPVYGFEPPSISQVLLLSKAGGIAYVGESRVAFEIVSLFNIYEGVVTVYFYGATYLHRMIIAAYNSHRFLNEKTTLGQVVAEGIARYIAYQRIGSNNSSIYPQIVVAEIMKLALLGDPVLELPSQGLDAGTRPRIEKTVVKNAVEYLSADIALEDVYGSIPVYKPSTQAVLSIYGVGTSRLLIIENKIVSTYSDLLYHRLVGKSEMEMVNGSGVLSISFDREKSGKLLIKLAVPGWGELRILIGVAGLIVKPNRAEMGGVVVVEGIGVDLLGFIKEAEIIVGGRAMGRVEVNPIEGSFTLRLSLPYLGPGEHNISLRIPLNYTLIVDPLRGVYILLGDVVKRLFDTPITVYSREVLDLIAVSPSIARVRDRVYILISVSLRGEHVDPKHIEARVVDPNGLDIDFEIKRLDRGLYLLIFNASNIGIYSALVNAQHRADYIEAYGGVGTAITVFDLSDIGSMFREEVATGLKHIQGSLELLVEAMNKTMAKGFEEVINNIELLSNRTIEIETKLGDIKGVLVDIDRSILVINTSIGVLRIDLDNIRDDLRQNIKAVISNITTVGYELGWAMTRFSRDILENITMGTHITSEKILQGLEDLKGDIKRLEMGIAIAIGVAISSLTVSIAVLLKIFRARGWGRSTSP